MHLTEIELERVLDGYKSINAVLEQALDERTSQLMQLEKHCLRQSEIIEGLRKELKAYHLQRRTALYD